MGNPSNRTTRREALALASAAAAAALAPGAEASAGVRRPLRRIVTSEDASGNAVVLADGEPTNTFVMNGTRVTRLWESPTVPADLPANADLGETAGNAYRDGFRGTSFYVAEIPPGSEETDIPLHKQDTLDYMAVLSGSVVLRIPGRDIELQAGDTIVQAGNLHTWINRGEEPCVLLFVVVAGERGQPAQG
jgi:hypothetical protein